MCDYAYYDDKETFRPKLYCKLQKGKQCLYSQYCIKVNKFIPSSGMENCFMIIEENKKNIPSGSYYVRFTRKGYIYVEIGDTVKKIKDTIGTVDNYIFLRQVGDEYEISLEPFNDVKSQNQSAKRTYRKKK